MRRFVILRLLAAAALVAFGVGVVVLTQSNLSAPPPPAAFTDLTAPLPADSEADLAVAMPAIEELRHKRGSLLDGKLLDAADSTASSADDAYVDLLRREARRLESHAADYEDRNDFPGADDLRAQADRLRHQARELHHEELARRSSYLDYQRQ